ncbi:MAG: hydrolase [Gammaproteobacteria bacterium]|nr:hydrolase [Gammaproteobacteria bacterium]
MKLVSYNIQYGKGQDNIVDIERIVGEIQGADVIALQEVDRFWPRTGMVDQVQQITERLPEYYWVYGAGVDLHCSQSPPHENRRRQFGNMILSRYPIESSRHHLLPKLGSIGPLSIQRSAIEASIKPCSYKLRIYSVHLTHLSSQTRIPQIERLFDIHNTAETEGFAVNGNLEGFDWQDGVDDQEVSPHAIIMGDFNCQPDSPEYDIMTGPKCDYGGRIISPKGFVDAWTIVGNDEDTGYTSDVHNIPARLDYCLVSSALKSTIVHCHVDSQANGSDHLPIWIELDFSSK